MSEKNMNIPMEVIEEDGALYCPTCHACVGYADEICINCEDICPECGQALDSSAIAEIYNL